MRREESKVSLHIGTIKVYVWGGVEIRVTLIYFIITHFINDVM